MKENYSSLDSMITDVIRHLNELHAEDRKKAKRKSTYPSSLYLWVV